MFQHTQQPIEYPQDTYQYEEPPPPSRLEIILKNWQPVALAILVLISLGNCVSLAALKNRRPDTFVQTGDGFGVRVEAKDNLVRTEAVVKRFVETWIQMTYDWGKEDIDAKTQAELGMNVLTQKVPVGLWLSMTVLDQRLIGGWLERFTESFKFADYLAGRKSRKMRIENIQVKDIGGGTYQAIVTATWIETASRKSKGSAQKWNRVITLKAIHQANPMFVNASDKPAMAAIYSLLQQGLIIVDFQ